MTTIEELEPGSFDLVASWLSDADVNRWLTAEWRNRGVTSTLIALTVRNKRNRLFLIRFEGQPCGLVALADLEVADKTAMVWYVLGDKALAGRGITSEAVRQLARFSFDQLALASLYAWAMEDNLASQKVLTKAGFRSVGKIRQSAASRDRQVDRLYYDVVAAEMR
jgi:RimJ/RimL family protein N-acetyltransferase